MRGWAAFLVVCVAACGGSSGDASLDASTDVPVVDAPAVDAPAADAQPDLPVTCTTDADGDGHIAASCGGDDCDDADASAYPGNTEVCDAAGHDDDCDPSTLGPDVDGDTFVGTGCCNLQPGGGLLCGTDCDDTRATVNPTAVETCNLVDDNCNGAVDEGLTVTYAPDCDGDGYGASTGTRTSCTPPATLPTCATGSAANGWVSVPGDCDDTRAAVSPAATEVCNGVDDDCDGTVDAEPAASASCSVHGASSCVSGACTIPVCPSMFLDCDASAPGCETNAATSPTNCGGCGNACAHPTCAGGVCVDDFVQLAAGDAMTCGRRRSGAVACWGWNRAGGLGDGTTMERHTPVAVTGITDAVQLTVGTAHACVTHAGGTVSCWGANGSGQLGNGTMTPSSTPVLVTGLTNVAAVDAGDTHTCARRTDGTVACWGAGGFGQLGDGRHAGSTTPVDVTGITDATWVGAGQGISCALHATTEVSCWGRNTEGELGNGMVGGQANTPVLAGSGTSGVAVSGVSKLAVGFQHVCVVVSSGTRVVCWGANDTGQLGSGMTSTPSAVPSSVMGISGTAVVTGASSGQGHSCVRRNGPGVFCWGDNAFGQLGDGTTTTDWTAHAAPLGGGGTVDVTTGNTHTCARLPSNAVLCWGSNGRGQLGDGTIVTRSSPTAILDP